MPRIGYKSAMFNQIDNEAKKYKSLTGSAVPKLERVIDEKFAPEFNSAEMFADDVLAESDYSFKKGVLSITVADDEDTIEAQFMGHQSENGKIVKSTEDVAPEFGYGHIVTKLKNSVKSYKVEFFPRVKWIKHTTDAKTKGKDIEFGTTAIEGNVFALDEDMNGLKAGTWEVHETFDTFAEAETMLKTLLTPSTN